VTYRKPISERNTNGYWGPLNWSYSTDFFRTRSSISSEGKTRQTMISPYSVLVTGEDGPFYRKRLLPNGMGGIVDGWHTANDYTIVLTYNGFLFRYDSIRPDNCSDYPDHIINLGDSYLAPSSCIKLSVNGLYNNKRVIAVHSTTGLLLLQVAEDTFTVEATLHLSLADYSLFGADSIQYVRFNGVEDLKSGEVLVGSVDITNTEIGTFETLVDLASRWTTETWDQTTRINPKTNTGEILRTTLSDYTGFPATPSLHASLIENGTFKLIWEQERPDLIAYYSLEGRTHAESTFHQIKVVNSGSVFTTDLTPDSAPYFVRMQAGNPDGVSGYSNTVYLGAPLAPVVYAEAGDTT